MVKMHSSKAKDQTKKHSEKNAAEESLWQLEYKIDLTEAHKAQKEVKKKGAKSWQQFKTERGL